MAPSLAAIGEAYLAELTESDLSTLLAAAHGPLTAHDLAAEPARVLPLFDDRAAFEAVFAQLGDEHDELAFVSPFLVFALCVHRCAVELEAATYVTEWYGARRRTPVFDVGELRSFLADPAHRLFLARLLGSFTHVTSGSIVVRGPRGLRRQRFSELDPVRLAGVLDHVAEHDRPAIYQRLGDLSLFLTGVFPDHTQLHGMRELDRLRLLRAARARPETVREVAAAEIGAVELLERLGGRFYRLAEEATPQLALPVGARREPGALGELAERFSVARRILNVVTDSFLFPFRSQVFPIGT